MNYSIFFTLVFSLTTVSAQRLRGNGGIPNCAVPCFVAAIPGTGCGTSDNDEDTKCHCTTGWQAINNSLRLCILTSCSSEDATKFTYYLQGTCKDVGVFPYIAPYGGLLSASTTATPTFKSLASEIVTSTSSQSADSQASSVSATTKLKKNVGAIAGGVVGGVAALIGVIVTVLICLRKRRRSATTGQEDDVTADANEKYTFNPSENIPPNAAAMSEKQGVNATTMSYSGQDQHLGFHNPAELPGAELRTHELSGVQNPRYEMSEGQR